MVEIRAGESDRGSNGDGMSVAAVGGIGGLVLAFNSLLSLSLSRI